MLFKVFALVSCLVLLAGASVLQVVKTPASVKFQSTHNPVSDVDQLFGELAGVTSEKSFDWDGVSSLDIFNRPKAFIVFETKTSGAVLPSVCHQYPISSVSASSFSSLVASVLWDSSLTASVSLNSVAALAGSAGLANERHHLITYDAEGKTFFTQSDAYTMSDSDVVAAFPSLSIDGAVFDAEKNMFLVTVDGQTVELPLSEAVVSRFFFELVVFEATLQRLSALPTHPHIYNFAASSLPALLSFNNGQYATVAIKVFESFVRSISSQASSLYGEQSVFVAIVARDEALKVAGSSSRRHNEVFRRSFSSPASSYTPPAGYQVDFCASYSCYCNGYNGKPFDPSTNCVDGVCSWYGCDCGSSQIMPSATVCSSCVSGYTLYNNHCYVDSNYPVLVNIVLWLGIAAVVALGAICYSLGYMDPGHDSIVYRLTKQKLS